MRVSWLLLGLVASLFLFGFAACTVPEYLGDEIAKAKRGTDGGSSDPRTLPGQPTNPNEPRAGVRGLPCDVAALLRAKCQSCHGDTPTFGAPMPLVSLEDLLAPSTVDPSKRVVDRVIVRMRDTARPMPPPPNAKLDARELQTLASWAEVGAPASTETCASGGDAGAPMPKPLSCTPDTSLAPARPFAMPTTTSDLYVCYGVSINVGAKKHITAIAPRIDNAKIVHHVLLMEGAGAYSDTPVVCGPEATVGARLVAAWAPGGGPIEVPVEAGFPMAGTARYVVQVHYNNAMALPGQTDRSGFDLCTTTKLRPFDADVVAFGTEAIVIPPRSEIGVLCAVQVPTDFTPVKVFGAMPHMHKIGTSIASSRRGLAGTSDLGSIANWDFQNQPWKAVQTTLFPGDVVTTRCRWKNTTSLPVLFGENSADEMCYSFVLYYPKITAPGFVWNSPAQTAVCTPTP